MPRFASRGMAVRPGSALLEAVQKQLFPDQETFKKEVSRRFETLGAHWDVPVEDVNLDD